MKRATEVRYPSSASLFQFCRRVLDDKLGGARVIDQDIGQILGFDPADCSHWKKGKKNIRSIQAMKSIAHHLGVDEKLVVDVAVGEINDTEAYHEYRGYGQFDLDSRLLETAKKDLFRKSPTAWTREREGELRKLLEVRRQDIAAKVQEIHDRIHLQEAPLYIPEVIHAYPEIKLDPQPSEAPVGKAVVTPERKGSTLVLSYPQSAESRPYVRFAFAKAIYPYFFPNTPTGDVSAISVLLDHANDVRSNIFAALLLTPDHLLRKEMTKVDVSRDIIVQLAETFWVSKTLMNQRVKEILAGS